MITETNLLELPIENIGIDVTLDYTRFSSSRALLYFNGFSWLENLFAAVIYKSMREYLDPKLTDFIGASLSFKFTELPTLKGFDELLNLRIEESAAGYHLFTGDFSQLCLCNISELRLGTICGSGVFGILYDTKTVGIPFVSWPTFEKFCNINIKEK